MSFVSVDKKDSFFTVDQASGSLPQGTTRTLLFTFDQDKYQTVRNSDDVTGRWVEGLVRVTMKGGISAVGGSMTVTEVQLAVYVE